MFNYLDFVEVKLVPKQAVLETQLTSADDVSNQTTQTPPAPLSLNGASVSTSAAKQTSQFSSKDA